MQLRQKVGNFDLNRVSEGDCLNLIPQLPAEVVDVVVTSPPYWGQRTSLGNGVEDDPRDYLDFLVKAFTLLLPKLKPTGVVWVNLGDAYNTPVNWTENDRKYSSLGPDQNGLSENNSAYIKPRAKRRAFISDSERWLQYGNLLALPYRLIITLCDQGYLYRGEVIWRKRNAMPEGRCRRPHRQHEGVYLLARQEDHDFKTSPPVKSVWEFGNEKIDGIAHYSRFPEELPRRCIEAYGKTGPDILVLDPFSGSGTTGLAARKLMCSFVGFEIDPVHAAESNVRIARVEECVVPLFTSY
jgi:DNA modification methylase